MGRAARGATSRRAGARPDATKPADSSEYRHLKSVRRRTSCVVSTALASADHLASRGGITVGLGAAPPGVPSWVISSPVVTWWHEPGRHTGGTPLFLLGAGSARPSIEHGLDSVPPVGCQSHTRPALLSGRARAARSSSPPALRAAPRREREHPLAVDRREDSRRGRGRGGVTRAAPRLGAFRRGQAATRGRRSHASRARGLALLRRGSAPPRPIVRPLPIRLASLAGAIVRGATSQRYCAASYFRLGYITPTSGYFGHSDEAPRTIGASRGGGRRCREREAPDRSGQGLCSIWYGGRRQRAAAGTSTRIVGSSPSTLVGIWPFQRFHFSSWSFITRGTAS